MFIYRPAGFELARIFVTDVYKYTEKIERKKLKNRREVQALAPPITHPSLACSKPLLGVRFYLNEFIFGLLNSIRFEIAIKVAISKLDKLESTG